VRAALRGGFAESRILDLHGQRMLERNFVPGGQVKSQLKNLRNVLAAAADVDAYASIEKTHPRADQSAALLALEKRNPGLRLGNSPDRLP
jgi:3-hydroxyisobutyrate dehydrogenase-like beta-hydroxyacid dehydrogenase